VSELLVPKILGISVLSKSDIQLTSIELMFVLFRSFLCPCNLQVRMDIKDSTRQKNTVNSKRKRKEEKTRNFVVLAYLFLPCYLFIFTSGW
jgi:hypothetical protein